MPYIDGFLIAVPKANKEAYRKMAEIAGPIFREHGATAMVECWGDDLPHGEVTSFPRAVKAELDETVVFSWVMWPSKAARDAGNPKIMEDPRLNMYQDPPFDGKRMMYGGFEVLLET